MTLSAEAHEPAARLSPRAYGATAIVATLLAFVAFARFGLSAEAFIAAYVVAVLTVLSAIDIDRHLLPNRIVLPSAALVLTANLVFFPDQWLEWIMSAAGAALLFGIAHAVYPAGLGMGDVKLALLLGAALGVDVVAALAIGSFAAALWGILLLIRHGVAARRQAMPLGPFLAFGAVLVLLA